MMFILCAMSVFLLQDCSELLKTQMFQLIGLLNM